MPDFKKRREEWAQALESGKYQQGKGTLRSYSGSFCCLGVACDIYDSTGWSQEKGEDFYYKACVAMPPDGILEFFGISRVTADSLVTMNDDLGKTFKEIADKIRSY